MLILSAHGKMRSAQARCDLRIATKSGLSFDSVAITESQALSWLSRTDCGVTMMLMPRATSFAQSSEFLAICSHSPSAEAAMIDHFMIDWRSLGIDSNFVLLRSTARISLGWWYDWVMQILRTSGRPYAVSEVVLLNSAASMTPRSSDDATSAPATEMTLAPANW